MHLADYQNMAILFERIEESNIFWLGCQLITRSWQLSVWRILSVWLEWIGKYPWLSRKLRRVWAFTIQHSYNLYLCKFCFRTCSHACSVVFDLFFPCLFFLQTMHMAYTCNTWLIYDRPHQCMFSSNNKSCIVCPKIFMPHLLFMWCCKGIIWWLHVYSLQTDSS